MTTGTETQEVEDAIARLWAEGQRLSLKRVEVIEATVAAVLLGDPVELDEAVSAAHRLAGTLGMFGLPGGSSLASEIELALEGSRPDELALDDLSDLVVELRASVESAPDLPADPDPPTDRTILRLVGGVRSYHEVLQLVAKSHGFDIRHAAVEEMETVDESEVLVMDCRSVEVGDLPAAIGPTALLVVAIVASADVSNRAALAARGVDLVVPAALEAERAVELITSELAQRKEPCRVTIVEPRSRRSGGLDFSLPDWPQSRIVVDELFAAPRGADDLIVLDASTMDPDTAADLCRAIRTDPTTTGAAVLVALDARRPSVDLVGRLLAAGADDVAWTDGGQLAARVRDLGRRATSRRAATTTATRSESDRSVVDVLQSRVDAARSAERALSVMFVTPRRIAEISETIGRDAADRLLADVGRVLDKHFRAHDVLGRWDAGLVVALDVDRATATERLAGLSAELERTGTELAGATALLDEDAGDARTLVELAAQWCRSTAEGPRSVGADDPSRSVLLVDDDPLIADLLTSLLANRGHRVEVVTDGVQAAELASHPRAADRYKLVVLDVSLPGLDGFGVLRRMSRAGSAMPPVVLVTARAAEAEVLAGLELGAIDHIAKPFSPLVLLRRLERVLGP